MSTESSAGPLSPWETIARHDWDGNEAIEATLAGALERLDNDAGDVLLYDYIDVEAVVDAFDPDSPHRGVSDVSFRFEDYLIRITQGGAVAARELPESARSEL